MCLCVSRTQSKKELMLPTWNFCELRTCTSLDYFSNYVCMFCRTVCCQIKHTVQENIAYSMRYKAWRMVSWIACETRKYRIPWQRISHTCMLNKAYLKKSSWSPKESMIMLIPAGFRIPCNNIAKSCLIGACFIPHTMRK